MSDTVIRVEGIGKQYHLGAARPLYGTLRDHLKSWTTSSLRTLLRRGRSLASKPSFWALKDVSFEVKQGDVVGIIGRNGAGKSTLLKILSRITEPTEGHAAIHGRVGSLLEVGTGFHPELTGRENVFLNGAILGMTRAEIKRRFDEIVAFAEVEKFIDTPVKHYSSGMYMRLAFAVAAHLEPEILIVDEVLAVGDAEFQKKCLGKMGDAAKSGRTVLFVSHNMQAVASLCNRAILLSNGAIEHAGTCEDTILKYMQNQSENILTEWNGEAGDEDATLLHTAVKANVPGEALRTSVAINIHISIRVKRPILGLICAVEIHNKHGARLLYSNFDDMLPPPATAISPGEHHFMLTIPANFLAAGFYQIIFDLGIHGLKRIVDKQGALQIQIENLDGIGRRYLAYDNVVRPAWIWNLQTTFDTHSIKRMLIDD
ncbi:MAG: ATP-binding cassette domain-containing protein [Planctomycetia bacterium]|nr:ATP-binding cassette domain-containing protein [Planctomycetia bacterium]